MQDLISRMAAIDALDKHLRETDVPVSYPGIISALTEWLNELPSTQPEVAKDTNVLSNDCISRQAAIDALYKMLHDCFWADDEELDAVITTLNELPSAQPEIIRCRDCKYGEQDDDGWWYCRDTGYSMGDGEKGDGFCSNAERRTDE